MEAAGRTYYECRELLRLWAKSTVEPEGSTLVYRLAPAVVAAALLAAVLVVPVAAVTLDASTENSGTVMVVDENSIAHETKVTVGIRAKDKMEITSGLKGGETFTIRGLACSAESPVMPGCSRRPPTSRGSAGCC